ncbi:voltage-dependent calcium channel gamma-7 subunit [Apis florea]|uniref:voltage-dependent calcium channel gamma-7 subunit n=1 Tax=Apis florea TaxID=7463 RepID=UPI000252AA62|nr:voltage-dependent calcium channel gamma-7 subunit [Apis florea]
MFFFAATSLLVVAEVCYFTAHVTHPRHRLCVFVAGVVFIVSGLLMLVGMVMYISVFKAEVGSKLRPRSSFQGPPFTYRYGFSFLLYVSGFITTEVAGTYAIFLYISWHQKELVRRDSRRKNYGVGSISFFYTTTAWTELTSA